MQSLAIAVAIIVAVILIYFGVQAIDYLRYPDSYDELRQCDRKDMQMVEGRRACFTELAIKEKDPSICDRIPKYPYTEGMYALARLQCRQDTESATGVRPG